MLNINVMNLSMEEQELERQGIHQQASLITIIGLIEGEILNFMENKAGVAITDIVNQLKFPEPIIMMGIGGLIREGIVITKRQKQVVVLINRI